MEKEIKVTPKMIAAGECEIDALLGVVPTSYLLEVVYTAMARVAYAQYLCEKKSLAALENGKG